METSNEERPKTDARVPRTELYQSPRRQGLPSTVLRALLRNALLRNKSFVEHCYC